MASILKLVAKFAAFGAAVPIAFYFASLATPIFPSWVLTIALALCPPYIFFLATAACDPFDACSLNMLGLVVLVNVIIYIFIRKFQFN